MKFSKITKALIVAGSVSTLFSASLMAAETTAQEKAEGIEKITVTSTKRVQTIQEIPMAVSAFSGESLENNGISNMADLAETVPNFYIGDGVVATNVNMRGMGSGGDRAFEQSVGMYIDNVYMPRSRQYRSPFFDAQRVEILRGPQAVLFGLNSTAGAVSVISAKTNPGDEFFADVTAGYESEYEKTSLSLVTGGSIGDNLGIRVALKQSNGDNFIQNAEVGAQTNENEDQLARLSLVWDVTDNLQLFTKLETISFDSEGSAGEVFSRLAANAAGDGYDVIQGPTDSLDHSNNVDHGLLESHSSRSIKPGLFQESDNFAAGFDWTIGEHVLTGTLGYTDMAYTFGVDLDTSPMRFYDAGIDETYEHSSAELRLTSPESDTFDYIIGAYYQESELFNGLLTNVDATPLGAPIQLNILSDSTIDEDLVSAFATGRYHVTEDLRIIAGVRYIDETKSIDRFDSCELYLADLGMEGLGACPFLAPSFDGTSFSDERTTDHLMPELIVQYDLSDDMSMYAKYAESVKSGGYASSSSVNPLAIEFDDEFADTVEIGLRASLADDQGQLFVTVFSTTYTDMQVNAFIDVTDPETGIVSNVTTIANAGEATNTGVEVETRWTLGEYFNVGASLSYLDAEYDDFKNGACSSSSQDAFNGNSTCDQSGQTLAYAPEISGTVYADFEYPMFTDVNFVAGVTLMYSDEYFTDGTNDVAGLQDSYTKVNARLGFEAADQMWSVSLIGKNISDETTLDVTQPFLGSYLGYAAAPRTVTLQGTYHFGEG